MTRKTTASFTLDQENIRQIDDGVTRGKAANSSDYVRKAIELKYKIDEEEDAEEEN